MDASSDDGDGSPVASLFCGDGIRDPVKEECDDGVTGPGDPCTADCRVRDVPVVASSTDGGEDAGVPPRSLGTAPHVASGSNAGLAVVFTEQAATPSVKLQRFGAAGSRRDPPIDVASDYAPLVDANPTVAELPDGRFAVAWTDGTSGSPEVRLRLVDNGVLGPAQPVRTTASGVPTDPDMVWAGGRLVVAWTDLFDVKVREFANDLTPLGPEGAIAATPAIESSVSLAPFGGGWASAVRSSTNGLESIVVQSGASTWTTPPEPPSTASDRPALVALDDKHLLVVFAIGTDPAETGTPDVPRLRAAVLSATSPGPVGTFALGPRLAGYASDPTLKQARPSAARVGDESFVAWENASPGDAVAGETVFLTRVAFDPAQPNGIVQDDEMRLPFGTAGAGWQTNPHVGVSTLAPAGALVSVWESASNGSARATSDLMLDLRPTPFVFASTGDAD
jgi:cysteine-rich repeat protein